jgi:hypothetical protein
MLLEWLSEAEQKLRYAAALPDDEIATQELIDIHAKFTRELREKERDKDETMRVATNILQKAHPDAVPIIKNWISIIQSRWEEISQWSLSREQKLKTHLQSLKDLENSIEELLRWLMGLESTLLTLEAEQLPDEIPPVMELINDHKEFMENTARRQPEVDRACKPKLPAAPPPKDHRKPSRASVLRTPMYVQFLLLTRMKCFVLFPAFSCTFFYFFLLALSQNFEFIFYLWGRFYFLIKVRGRKIYLKISLIVFRKKFVIII